MALVGSGASQVKNFATAASLSASDVDESLAAFVEQLGGVKWLNGASARCAGNLTYDNFATSPALPNRCKREPRSVWVHSMDSKAIAATAVPFHVGTMVVPVDCVLDSWSVCVSMLTSSKTAEPVMLLYVNGAVAATASAMTEYKVLSSFSFYRSGRTVGLLLPAGTVLSAALTAGGSALTQLTASSHFTFVGDHL